MKNEMYSIWHEVLGDFATSTFVWQLLAIITALLFAGLINRILRVYVTRHSPIEWRIAIQGINRVLFPLTALLFLTLARLIIQHWQHVGMIKLATTLLIAMAVIRLAVYALRYVFSPSGWVEKTEHVIATSIWIILALHLSGLLPDILQSLDDVVFSVGKLRISLLVFLQGLSTVVITVVAALWISRIIENRLMRAEHLNANMRVVIGKVLRIVLTVAGVLTAFSIMGLDITLLSVFGGALGVGLGFGLQKIASNFVSGFIILLDDSIHMGDIITIDAHYGIVSDLRARYLVLRKHDGTEVVIPNETLITTPVINHSFTDNKARIQMAMQVSYDSPLELAMQLMKDAAMEHERVLKQPEPEVLIKGFGESGIDLLLSFWIPDPEEGSAGMQSAIYMAIWKRFNAQGVHVPYPQREIRIVKQE